MAISEVHRSGDRDIRSNLDVGEDHLGTSDTRDSDRNRVRAGTAIQLEEVV